jgi:hypothetical protein
MKKAIFVLQLLLCCLCASNAEAQKNDSTPIKSGLVSSSPTITGKAKKSLAEDITLYYTNTLGAYNWHFSLWNTVTNEFFDFDTNNGSGGILGTIPEGNYNVEIMTNYNWQAWYWLGCNHVGLSTILHYYYAPNIDFEYFCNTVSIGERW